MRNKVRLERYDNSDYKPGMNPVIRVIWFLLNGLVFDSYLFPFSKLKVFILRIFGANIGKGCVIKPKIKIKYPWKLTVGNNCWIGEEVWIDNLAMVSLGNSVCLSQGAMLLCGNHDYKKIEFDLITKEIRLSDGVWIGAKSILTPGISAGEHSVLTVGSVASKNLEPYGIYSGIPAMKVKEREIQGEDDK